MYVCLSCLNFTYKTLNILFKMFILFYLSFILNSKNIYLLVLV